MTHSTTDAPPLLKIEGLEAGYGDVQILWGADLEVKRGAICSIVGSNGAGKSTLLLTISGMIPAKGGRIVFDGADITNKPVHEIVAGGIVHVPEGRRLFNTLSVEENLRLGAYARKDAADEIEKDLDFVYSVFPILKERSGQVATTMSGGEQQMCAIGRGIMARPKLLLLDELSLGLAPKAVELLAESLVTINRQGISILLVEQDVITAFEIGHYGYVMEHGRISMEGTTAMLIDDPKIQQAYMGI